MDARLNKVKERRNQQRRAQGLADIEFEIGGNKKSEEVNSNGNLLHVHYYSRLYLEYRYNFHILYTSFVNLRTRASNGTKPHDLV